MLKLFLFGTPRLMHDDQPVKLARRKSLALLCYLVMHPRPLGRDTLATLLWGELDQERSRSELRVSLWGINKAIGEDWLINTRDTVQLNPDKPLWADVRLFEEAINAPKAHHHHADEVCVMCLPQYENAVSLYTHDFLAGFGISNAPEFDDWVMHTAESLRIGYIHALKKLVIGYSAQSQFETSLRYAQRWIALDPFNEEAHRWLMCLHIWTGNKTASLGAYSACVKILADELDVEPSSETTQLFQDIKAGHTPDLPPIYYDLPDPLAHIPNNLPVQPNPFRGRNAEIAHITRQLSDPDCRLVTIVGLGGAGKTRLALHIARQVLSQFADGVYVLPLMGVGDANGIITAIADALGFQFSKPTDLIGQLSAYLAPQKLLLVLDNFEHLLDHISLIDHLLTTAPHLKMMVTSRLMLNLKSEWVFNLDQMTDGAEQLFIDTATRVDNHFAPSDDDRQRIRHICDQLAGMPLAIELASTWVRVLSICQISDEIKTNLADLATDWADMPDRHRSLGATFDYSWRLLSSAQQASLAKLAIFPAQFNHESAKFVTHIALPMVSSLMGHGLLKRNANGWYELHPLIRQFAYDKLRDMPPDFDHVTRGIIGYVNQRLMGHEATLKGIQLLEARHQIMQEIDTIRFAFTLALDKGFADMLMDAVNSLALFYDYQAWYSEGMMLFKRIADVAPSDTLIGLRAKIHLARFYHRMGDYSQAEHVLQHILTYHPPYPHEIGQTYLQFSELKFSQNVDMAIEYAQKAYEVYDELQDTLGQGRALRALSEAYSNKGDTPLSLDVGKRALALLVPLGDILELAPVYRVLSRAYMNMGDSQNALAHAQKSVDLYERYDAKDQLIRTQAMLTAIQDNIGDYLTAKAILEDAIEMAKRFGMDESLVYVLMEYGTNSHRRQDYPPAIHALEQAIALTQRLQLSIINNYVRSNLAMILTDTGDFDRAVTLSRDVLADFRARGDVYGIVGSASTLCGAYISMGRYHDAILLLKEWVKLAHDNQLITFWTYGLLQLGICYFHLGDIPTATTLITFVHGHDGISKETQLLADEYHAKLVTQLGNGEIQKLAKPIGDIQDWIMNLGL